MKTRNTFIGLLVSSRELPVICISVTAGDVVGSWHLQSEGDHIVMKRVLFVFAILVGSGYAQTKEPVTHEALWLMPRVGAPSVSPDGKLVVFSVTEPAYDEKDQASDLWIVPSDGSTQARRLTWTKAGESSVAWSPGSERIAFVTRREGDDAIQIYVLDLAGGEARRVTTLSTGAASPVFRPDGKAVLFTSRVYPGAADDTANRRIAEERKKQKYTVREFESFPVRRWDHWFDDRQIHVFVQNLETNATAKDLLAGTKLTQNTGYGGRDLDNGEELDAIWAPDGQSVLFVATTARNTGAYASVHTHLYQVPAGGGEPRQLTSGNRTFEHPRFRPDGRALYFSVTDDHNQIYAHERIGMAPWPWSGEPKLLTAAFDRSVGSWAITGNGESIYLTAENEGLENLYSLPANGGEVKLVISPPRGVYTNLVIAAASPSPVLIANWGSSIEPSEIVRLDAAAKQHKPLTAFATDRAAKLDWQAPQHFSFTSSRGRRIHNMLVLPAQFDPNKKYPLLVEIHGGPATMWRDQITLRWNYHLIARPGYVVLLTNYSGSPGFGEEFARSIQRDPFAGPGSELNEAADEAIRRFPFIDGSRQCAAGASYGGHLANWLEATTTRYRCLISHAGLANSEAQWGTSDAIYHRELMADGPPWEQTKVWSEQNPIRRAASFKTPMLLSVGEQDFRVPINNTLEMWSALQRMKVPSRLLVWPNANHWITNGEDSRQFYREVHAWLTRWLQPAVN
jgi:dipeptidyl aminopeptidase/acylaminoacyl peptidase